jgi:hypothetical protein
MGQFSDRIAEHIGLQRILFINDFSTTGRDARIGSEALLMYGMAKYFDYGMSTCCGFPSITLEGTPDDWQKIVDRVSQLRGYILGDDDHLKTWLAELEPIVEEFARAADGKPDLDFWRSLYKEGGGSGGPYITGHVLKFYPYLTSHGNVLRPNVFPKEDPNRWGGGGLTFGAFPKSFSPVDVKWERLGAEMDMVFQGGLVGVTYDEGVVRPTVGWCVTETLDVPDEQEAY